MMNLPWLKSHLKSEPDYVSGPTKWTLVQHKLVICGLVQMIHEDVLVIFHSCMTIVGHQQAVQVVGTQS